MYLYVMCGIPGSGKTTLSKEFSQKYNLTLYSYDELKANKRCFDRGKLGFYIETLVRDSIEKGQNVILDDLYITKESRRKLLTNIFDIPCKKILIVMQTPLDICIERDATRMSHKLGKMTINSFNQRYEPPTLDEGWDEILYF